MLKRKHDRWSLWPFVTLLSAIFSMLLVAGMPGTTSFILIPLLVLGWPFALVAAGVAAGLLFIRLKPRKAISLLGAVLLVCVFLKPINRAAVCAHVVLTTQFGIGQIGVIEKEKGSNFDAYDWSVGLSGGPNMFLIRDPSDKIIKSLGKREKLDVSSSDLFKSCSGNVRYIFRNYYLCKFY